jgi:hypothetical protein
MTDGRRGDPLRRADGAAARPWGHAAALLASASAAVGLYSAFGGTGLLDTVRGRDRGPPA